MPACGWRVSGLKMLYVTRGCYNKCHMSKRKSYGTSFAKAIMTSLSVMYVQGHMPVFPASLAHDQTNQDLMGQIYYTLSLGK